LLATRLLFDRLDRTLLESASVSLPDFIVLFRLAQAGDEGMRMSELADAGVFSRSRISHAFSRLEREGWVERRSCPTDRRGSFGFLTDSGRLKLAEAEPSHTAVIESYFLDAISPDDSAALNRVTGAMRLLLNGDPNEPPC
jgi:DNA-binding MarR family transcriptional regulator